MDDLGDMAKVSADMFRRKIVSDNYEESMKK
jgi:hypothetical protein